MSTTAIDTSGAGQKKNIWSLIKGTDFLTMFTALAASIYGLTLVYSASYSSLSDGKVISSDVRSMLVSVIGGFIISVILSNIDYDVISKLWPIVAAGCVGLMIFTFFFGVAPPSRPDSKCWIDLKIFYFQPSELMKVGFIISFSYHLDLVRDKINKIKTIIPLVIHGAIPVGLVILTGDAGSALIFLIMFYRDAVFCKSKHRIFCCRILCNICWLCCRLENRNYQRYSKAKNCCIILSRAIRRRNVSANQRQNCHRLGRTVRSGLFTGQYDSKRCSTR